LDSLLYVLIIIQPHSDSSVAKYIAINNTTKVVSMVVIPLIIRKYNMMTNFKMLGV